MKPIFYIAPNPVGLQEIEQILKGNVQLVLSEEAKQRIIKCRNYLDAKMQNITEPIYGVTTGFGALHDRTISLDQLTTLQENLVKSHACGLGDEVSPAVVRLMLFLKAHALSKGFSGVSLQTVERIVDMYNHDVLPVVYQLGSLGASGDLAPLAHLFLPLIGEGEVRYEGQLMPSTELLNKMGWNPIKLQSKEGLALLNGTQFMSAHGVVALLSAMRIARLADLAGSLSLDAFNGRIEPFNDNLHQIRPHAGQQDTGFTFRHLLTGSELLKQPKKHVQDPYSFRCIPQVHGASKDAISYATQVILTEINSVTDNPTIFPDEDLIVSGGNFHGQPLAITYDFMAIAIAELGSISERRVYRLISGWRDLPEFLTANSGLNSGFMIPQYAAAAIVSQNKQLATPASVDSIPSSNEQEDHVSMGGNAATRLLKMTSNLEKILAVEWLNAAQAIEFRRPLKTSPILEEILSGYRAILPMVTDDVVMYHYINKTIDFMGNIPMNKYFTFTWTPDRIA